MKRKAIFSGMLTLLLVALCAWLWMYRVDRQVDQIKKMQAEVFSKSTRDLPEDQRRQKYAELREQYKQLSEHQRRQVRQQMHDDGQQRMSARIHQYFELPKAQRVAYLDQQINEMEKRRKQTSGRDSGPKGGGVRGSGPTPRERGKSMSDADRQERRDRFKRSRLDGSTPRQRAELAEYFDALRKRREQRGLPDSHRRGPQGSRVNVG